MKWAYSNYSESSQLLRINFWSTFYSPYGQDGNLFLAVIEIAMTGSVQNKKLHNPLLNLIGKDGNFLSISIGLSKREICCFLCQDGPISPKNLRVVGQRLSSYYPCLVTFFKFKKSNIFLQKYANGNNMLANLVQKQIPFSAYF